MQNSKIILIDNYDSFTYNLAQYFWELGYNLEVFRNDSITISEIESMSPTHLVISPGPGTPSEAGICLDIIDYFKEKKPILGVCLGHQCIGQFAKCSVEKAPIPRHGKVSVIEHNGDKLFNNIPNKFSVTRYHSLIISESNFNHNELEILSKSLDDKLIMSIKHKKYQLFGVQFHPESIMTEYGKTLLQNFMNITGI